MQRPSVVIVQPWFTAFGHPAQSTLNTARVLGKRMDVQYLIEDPRKKPEFAGMAEQLERFSPVRTFRTIGESLATKTLCASVALVRQRKDLPGRIFFLDASLIVLSIVWPFLKFFLPTERMVSMVYLRGPEDVMEHPVKRRLVRYLLSQPEVRFYLRTEELAASWRTAFPQVPGSRIDTIPSLEIPDEPLVRMSKSDERRSRFGIVGQIRPGKSIEWLAPLFKESPDLGALLIAGQYFPGKEGDLENVLKDFPSFTNQFLSEQEMIRLAASQDYLVMLYDNWDVRMEAATLFVAARAGVPVLVYDEGWCGRMVREYGCGLGVSRTPRPAKGFFASLPARDSDAYKELLDGICRFREAFSGQRTRNSFISKVGLSESRPR